MPDKDDLPPDPGFLPPEIAWLIEWRKQLMQGAGFPEDEAEILAGLLYIDHHEAESLRRRGCDFDTLLQILT